MSSEFLTNRRHRWPLALGALALAAAALLPGAVSSDSEISPAPGVTVERTRILMGTRVRVRVTAAAREEALAVSDSAFAALRRSEELLSTWREDTELARLNRAPVGQPFRASPRLFDLLSEVWRWSDSVGGAFDPAVGALVDAWDLRGDGRRPGPDALRSARAASGRECFRLEAGARTVTPRCPEAWIDAGGFGKGAALERALRVLERSAAGGALVDAGGQLLAVGSPPDRRRWRIAVAHPERRDEPIGWLAVRDASVATSSLSERSVVVGGVARGHVLDPRTGRPAPDWGSVTVVSRDPVAADVLSTALYVLGPEEGLAWARAHGPVPALFLETTGQEISASWTRSMQRYLTSPIPMPGAGSDE